MTTLEIYEPDDMRDSVPLRLLDRPIAFHRIFVELTGSVTAALMLSQAVYWSRRTKDKAGWFYKTQEEWTEETGLSRSETTTARKKLKGFDWWQEDLRKADGAPTVHYRINMKSLYRDLTGLEAANGIAGIQQNQGIAGIQQNHKQRLPETTTTSPAANKRKPTEFQRVANLLIWFTTGVNWDDPDEDPGRKELVTYSRYVRDAKKILKSGKTEQDMRAWWSQVWVKDWRWKDKHQLPTTNQVLEGLAKMGAAAPTVEAAATTVAI